MFGSYMPPNYMNNGNIKRYPPIVKVPTKFVDLLILKDSYSNDFDKDDLIKVYHRQCGGEISYFDDPIDPLMSEFTCIGNVTGHYRCPAKWKFYEVKSFPKDILGKTMTTQLIIDDLTYDRPVKLEKCSTGGIVYTTARAMTDTEVDEYFEKVLEDIRQNFSKR